MKMKLLDTTLLAILATFAAGTSAQSVKSAGGPTGARCDEHECRDDQGLLFRVRPAQAVAQGSGSNVPAATAADAASTPDHAAGRYILDLPGGGAVWLTEDPAATRPTLDVQAAATVAYDGQRIMGPVAFHGTSNYPAFIERLEITVYRGSDVDLIMPLATIAASVSNTVTAQWDGALAEGLALRAGDELLYVTRAYGRGGAMDETVPRRIRLVTPEQHARANLQAPRAVAGTRAGGQRGAGDPPAVEAARAVPGQDSLRIQNIPVHGSRVRIHGRDLPDGAQISINGAAVPVDAERRFAAEFLEPIGLHRYRVHLQHEGGVLERLLEIEVTGRYSFLVALADVTVSRTSASGGVEPLAGNERFGDSLLSEGRLAFYLKGKIRGRYLLTAQADTREREVRDLFDGFLEAYPQDIFRRLDPDLYYPVYGDDSTTYRDVDTQGRLYVRLDWDRNRLLWGNFDAGLSGTEYGQFQRSLYGAALDWRSTTATRDGEARTSLKAFASQARTVPGHSELLGTGGSLYYLRHTDLLPGSDHVVLEVRDRTTGRVEARVELQRGVDYEIDALQGRLVLSRPLAQVTRDNVRTLTRDAPLDGFEQRLLADYEYIPSGFEADDVVAGLRGRHWFGDHVAIGATHVDERRGGEDYRIDGADLTLQAGRGTYLRLEQTRTASTAAPVFYSDNGGLSFVQRNPQTAARGGEARAAEARINLQALGWTAREWSAGGWWRDVDSGFSISRFDTGRPVREYGAEMLGYVAGGFSLFGRFSHAAHGAESLRQAQLTADWRLDENQRFGAEVRQVREQRVAGQSGELLGALSYHRRVNAALEVYGIGQGSMDRGTGEPRNDLLTLGARYAPGEAGSAGIELSGGSRGHGLLVDAEKRVGADHTLYGGYRYSTDSTSREGLFDSGRQNGWTLGQRWRLSDRVNLFNEHQALKDPHEGTAGLAHTFGLDFAPRPGWQLGLTVMDGTLDAEAGRVDRRAYSLGGGRSDANTQWNSRLEYRQDRGAEQREQWVTSHRLMHRVNEDWSIAGRIQMADTQDRLDPMADARLVESNLGFAWRPKDTTRWAAFGRFTYLYDLASGGQAGGAQYDQRTRVLSFEGIRQLDAKWEFAGKLALRDGDYRMGRGSGPWFDSRADFAAAQARYHLISKWDALAEYRWLGVRDGGDRRGWLLGVDRQLGPNFKVGAGYNFTDFSDDLTRIEHDQRGWFLNLSGYY